MGGYASYRIEAAEIRPPAICPIMLYIPNFQQPPVIGSAHRASEG
jgi:hypothetical protein